MSSTTIEKLTRIINTTINNKQPHQLGLGILLPIQKDNKTKKVENTRPIILLFTIIQVPGRIEKPFVSRFKTSLYLRRELPTRRLPPFSTPWRRKRGMRWFGIRFKGPAQRNQKY